MKFKHSPRPFLGLVVAAIAAAGFSSEFARAADGTWITTGANGNWSDPANWSGGVVADGVGATATFAGNTLDPLVVTIDSAHTVGILNLITPSTATAGTVGWSFTGIGPTLTLDNTGFGNAQINVTNRNNPGFTNTVDLILNSDLDINKSGITNTTFQMSAFITGTNRTINVNGTGTMQNVSVTNIGLTTTLVNSTWVVNNATLNMNTGFKGDATTAVILGTGSGDSQLNLAGATLATTNTITVGAGGTTKTLRNVSTTTNTGSIVLNGNLIVLNTTTAGSNFNLAGAAGATITGTGGIDLLAGTGSGGTVTIAGAASHTGTNTLTAGNLTVSATGSLNGSSTVVNTGRTFTLSATADYTFDILTNGVNDSITGIGIATLNGDFVFNLSGADSTVGNIWNIVDVNTLTETFNGTFTVANAGATNAGGVWTFSNAGTDYQFSTLTGQLSVVPEPGTVALLLGGIGVLTLFCRRRAARVSS